MPGATHEAVPAQHCIAAVKIAIFSDVHSNLEALQRCCDHAAEQGAERYVCLGDIIGYGADPGPTLERLMALPGLIAIRGNHDETLFRDPGDGAPPAVRHVLSWTREQLSAAQLDFLSALPYSVQRDDVTYVHASADNPQNWEYVRIAEQAERCIHAARTSLTFIGHTHEPYVFYETAGGQIRELRPASGRPIPLSPRSRYLVNVGSLGQPRDGNASTCYVLHNEDHAELTFFRLSYDFQRTAGKIRAAGLAPHYADRLAVGR